MGAVFCPPARRRVRATRSPAPSSLTPSFIAPRRPQYHGKPIKVTLPDGAEKEAVAGETTALDIAGMISQGLRNATLAAKVDGVVTDAWRPLVASCALELLTFKQDEGKAVFWHSSAHLLGQAMEVCPSIPSLLRVCLLTPVCLCVCLFCFSLLSQRFYGCRLCIGPPLEGGGFYYDCEMYVPLFPSCVLLLTPILLSLSFPLSPRRGERHVTQEDYKTLDGLVSKMIKEKQVFERLDVAKETALRMFEDNKYKLEIINSKVADGTTCSVYRNGPFVDLCRGPHVPNTVCTHSRPPSCACCH